MQVGDGKVRWELDVLNDGKDLETTGEEERRKGSRNRREPRRLNIANRQSRQIQLREWPRLFEHVLGKIVSNQTRCIPSRS